MKNQWKTMMALMLCAGVANAAYVTIGGAGNSDDTTGYGGVSYEYKISSTEVSIAEFQAYRTATSTTGNEGYWNEEVRTVGTAAPATMVTLYEAMKYCNYLTSGDVNDGVYNFSGETYQSTDRASAMATHGTIYALPTEDEWYKAAYYNVSGNSYSLYADGSGTVPTEGGGSTGWNYNGVNSSPNYTRDVADGSSEENSTVNMNGNVFEWMEDSAGVIRGGSYDVYELYLRSSSRYAYAPSSEADSVGFRLVGVVPEPATAGMLAISGLLIAGYRRFKKHYSL